MSGTVLAPDQEKALVFTGDELGIVGITCCELCQDVWKYEFECPVCLDDFAEAIGLHEPNWHRKPFVDDDDKLGCRCGAHYTKTVPGVYRMDTTWRLSCSDGCEASGKPLTSRS